MYRPKFKPNTLILDDLFYLCFVYDLILKFRLCCKPVYWGKLKKMQLVQLKFGVIIVAAINVILW